MVCAIQAHMIVLASFVLVPHFVGTNSKWHKFEVCRISGCRKLLHVSRYLEGRWLRPLSVSSKCFLDLQEYQSKELMKSHGINVQKFQVADGENDVSELVKQLDVSEVVIKAQVLAGGRGKGTFSSGLQGGVKLSKNFDEIPSIVDQMIGHSLVTKQTGQDGVVVRKVMLGEALDISRETYLAILMDRAYEGPVIVASPEGGVDIEEVAEKTPDKIYKFPIDINSGIKREQALELADKLNFRGLLREEAAAQIEKLYELFIARDATQVEVNPFGETDDGRVVCFDAKINFDDNAKFRQEDLFASEDISEKNPREVEARKYDLNYIGMDGNIACIVNGAGLAMATMDMIKLHEGEPANFLDLGGGIQEEGVHQAFKIIISDKNVEAILVNIFGGIVDCKMVAKGIQAAYEKLKIDIPLIVRLEGRNVVDAKKILKSSGIPVTTAEDLDEAAMKAVSSLV
ncbi:succinate--CoA ligase [GDP-forming] subunit beta, mitochondrial-like [Dendronephthya gigantea]|uniref:succinate--CoA ligase [GDP-forming] subunit beta, mitochondrial-like n=1 Tax=Dendronephthya gigantea TaxID=151771 RepID=UPI00106ACE6A|nr:succinate--CoA ligase [GDP-forming] subunit beta, mitochondrial-like [Dendronephthya gigantea]